MPLLCLHVNVILFEQVELNFIWLILNVQLTHTYRIYAREKEKDPRCLVSYSKLR